MLAEKAELIVTKEQEHNWEDRDFVLPSEIFTQLKTVNMSVHGSIWRCPT